MKRENRIKELQDYAMFMQKVLSNMNPSNENYRDYKNYLDNSIKEMNELITNKSANSNNKVNILVLESYFDGVVKSAEIFINMLGEIGLNQRRRQDDITLENNNVKVEIVKIKQEHMFTDDLNMIRGKKYNLVINHSSLDEDIVKSLIK